ncbi:hypothetical protein [Streptacidiphilus rugosus]|uniref:hypothetical protein n=1 Tax=Streptacidiphilus rugosus TaxID=405783 RepID=UPI0005699A83|nr:hypothetical protein [Streptacidiphilus rugosus]
MITLIINGVERRYDNSRLMFSESMEIQKATGLGTAAYEKSLGEGDALAWAALYWVVEVRVLAAEQNLSFREAAGLMPFADFDVNLNEANASMKRAIAEQAEAAAEDPTPASADPSGPTAPTSPATSEPASPQTTSPVVSAATSEPSPSSSESAPGSGISSPSPTSTA